MRFSFKPKGRRSVPDAAEQRRQQLADREGARRIAQRAREEELAAEEAAVELLRAARRDAQR